MDKPNWGIVPRKYLHHHRRASQQLLFVNLPTQTRRAAFTTHCPGFDARMQQRQAEHERDSAEKLNRARQAAADRFRSDWESARESSQSYSSDPASNCGNQPQGKEKHRANSDALGLGHQLKRQRPFLRQQWLHRLQQQRRASGEASACTGAASAVAADLKSLQSSLKNSQPSSRVRKDHVKSVVHLVSSEARANAFVVISSLEGLLSVATERGTGPKSLGKTSSLGDDARLNVAHAGGSSRGETGAALCVRLGALPAVLGCLDEHAGHRHIEPLAARLLRVFASDRATEGAIKGNARVAAACASRMFPTAEPPAARGVCDSSVGGTVSGASRSPSDGTRARDKAPGGAGSGGCGEHAEDGRSSEALSRTEKAAAKSLRLDGPLVETACGCGSAASTEVVGGRTSDSLLSEPAPLAVSTASLEHAPTATSASATSTPALSSMSGPTTTPFNKASTPAEEATAIPGPEESREESSSAVTGQGHPARLHWLPATDLVLVLAVAVRDSPECQRLVTRSGGIAAMLAAIRRRISTPTKMCGACASEQSAGADETIGDGARLVEACLTVTERLGRPGHARRRLVKEGSVETAISTIEKFRLFTNGSH